MTYHLDVRPVTWRFGERRVATPCMVALAEALDAPIVTCGQARCHLTERPTRLRISPISICTVIPTSIS
jgi:hypothetical protein